jgi:hypothetical protein
MTMVAPVVGIVVDEMRRALLFGQLCLLSIGLFAALLPAQQPVASQRNAESNGMPSSGGYRPPDLSLSQLLEADRRMNEALTTFMRTGDTSAYKAAVLGASEAQNLAAELLLA